MGNPKPINEPEENENVDEEEEEDDDNRMIIRAKWCIDGCLTLEECARALEEYADSLRRLKNEGWELTEEVQDDYGFVSKN